MVLAASSSYFFAMFSGFTERDSSRVVLQGIDPEVSNEYLWDPMNMTVTT